MDDERKTFPDGTIVASKLGVVGMAGIVNINAEPFDEALMPEYPAWVEFLLRPEEHIDIKPIDWKNSMAQIYYSHISDLRLKVAVKIIAFSESKSHDGKYILLCEIPEEDICEGE